jgi:hypothetical protein
MKKDTVIEVLKKILKVLNDTLEIINADKILHKRLIQIDNQLNPKYLELKKLEQQYSLLLASELAEPEVKTVENKDYGIWEYFNEQHNLQLLESEVDEIVRLALKDDYNQKEVKTAATNFVRVRELTDEEWMKLPNWHKSPKGNETYQQETEKAVDNYLSQYKPSLKAQPGDDKDYQKAVDEIGRLQKKVDELENIISSIDNPVN